MNKKSIHYNNIKWLLTVKKFFYFTTEYYLAEYENALFSFGKSTICKDIKPFAEIFQINKKQAEMARAGLENCFIRDPDCELWTFSQHGAFSDYDWQWNEEEKANYGTLKEK